MRGVVSGIGWSKVVGSGSNLVATPIISNAFPLGHPPMLSRQARFYAAGKLHGTYRCQRPPQSSNGISAADRREARQRLLYHEPHWRVRSSLPIAGMGVDRAETFVVAIDGSGAKK